MFDRARGNRSLARSRWVALGAALAVLAGSGGLLSASASGSANASSFVPITPCRLLDTRAANVVGTRSTPLGQQETLLTPVWGTNGNCTIPTGATGLSMDVVAVNATGSSFLTVFPADQPLPLSSNLNWVAGQPPTPNAVTVAVSSDGRIGFFNNAGTVDIAVDIVGFYEPSNSGPAGPPGPAGPAGPAGVAPAQVVWVAKSGGNFTSVNAALASITTNSATNPWVIKIGPGTFAETSAVVLKDHVDIEGSGQDATIITCSCGSFTGPGADGTSATLRATGATLHSEVRFLAVSNTGVPFSTGIWTNLTTRSVSLLHVTVTVSSPNLDYGVYNLSSAPAMDDMTVTVGGNDGYAVSNDGSAVTMNNITATAVSAVGGFGIFNTSSTVTISNSYITGTTNSVYRNGGTARLSDTKLNGGTFGMAGRCFNVFDIGLLTYTCV